MNKKALLIAAALAGSPSVNAQTTTLPEPARDENTMARGNPENSMSSAITKTTIIESLQAIRKDPATIKFHSAMCYDMSMPPADTTFSCPDCGAVTQYLRRSFQGKVAEQMPSLQRSLTNATVKISVDSSDFCNKCSKNIGKEPELRFITHCLDCGQTFPWKITQTEEINRLELLFVSFPLTSIDMGQKGSQLIEPEKLAEYLANRFLCPVCCEKHGLK